MQLGNFSLSLTVKNIEASAEFYRKLGFTIIDGGHTNEHFKDSEEMKWRVMEHDSVKIGLFQGMFRENILTFNPKDALAIQESLRSGGVTFIKEAKETDASKSVILEDPDGNRIMLDQH